MTPPQLQKMQRYCLQHLFFSDGWLMVYAAREWLDSGRLQPPSPEQRASLTTLLLTP